MTHELIKESNEYTAEATYSSQCLQGICPIKFKAEKELHIFNQKGDSKIMIKPARIFFVVVAEL